MLQSLWRKLYQKIYCFKRLYYYLKKRSKAGKTGLLSGRFLTMLVHSDGGSTLEHLSLKKCTRIFKESKLHRASGKK